MYGLSKEAIVKLNETLDFIRDKDTSGKVNLISIILGVNVHPYEIALGEKTLKEIIEGRMLRACPKCKGNFTFGRVCDLCKGHGEIDGIMEEKFFLSQKQMKQMA